MDSPPRRCGETVTLHDLRAPVVKKKLAELLAGVIGAEGLQVSPERQRLLLAYLELLRRWNRAYNLTAITGPEEMVRRHLLESLRLLSLLHGRRVLDVGSGAGVPGMVLAIADPQRDYTLLDARGKRTRFLTQVRLELGLDNVTVVRARLERYRPATPFDTLLARAFAPLPQLLPRCRPLLAAEGLLLAMVGPATEVPGLGFRLERELPDPAGSGRRLLLLRPLGNSA